MSTELEWLRSEQPIPTTDSTNATAAARAELLAHIATAPEFEERVPAPAQPARRGPKSPAPAGRGLLGQRGDRRRRLVPALILAGAAAVTAGAFLGGSHSSPNLGPLAPAAAQAAPIVRLSHALAAAPPATGDATYTVHHDSVDGKPPVAGYDLVPDASSIDYFGQSQAEMRAASASATGGEDSATGPGSVTSWIRAAAASAASDQTPAQAAAALNAAMAAPIIDPSSHPTSPKTGAPVHVISRQAQYENHVWIVALSVLELAGGRPEVRAGALKAIAAVGIPVVQATQDGRAVLRITSTDTIAGLGLYDETLTIDASTGIPISFFGGTRGKTPDVAETFDVQRVNAADYGH